MTTVTTRQKQQRHSRRTLENTIIECLDCSDRCSFYFTESGISKLQCFVDVVDVFNDSDEFVDSVTAIQNELMIWIVADIQGKIIIPLLHDLPQLYSIYVLTDDHQAKWTQDYRKVKGVFHDILSICACLKSGIKQIEQDTIPISTISGSTIDSLNKLEASFMYSQLLKEIILDNSYTPESKIEFVEHCRAAYYDNRIALKVIEEFNTEYATHNPVWW